MNKKRRAALNRVLDDLDLLAKKISKKEALDILQKSCDEISDCADDEECAYDSLPESLKYSSNAESLSDNVSDLQDAICDIEFLMVEVDRMSCYDYALIIEDLNNIVNTIRNTIDR